MPTKIIPPLVRRTLVEPEDCPLLAKILKKDHPAGILGVRVPLYSDGDLVHATAGLRFLREKSWSVALEATLDIESDEDVARDLSRVALTLLDSHAPATEIDEIDSDRICMPFQGNYSVTLFPGCAIFSADDPAGWMMGQSERLKARPARLSDRAPFCTVILEDTSSRHARAAQPAQVSSALSRWSALHRSDLQALSNGYRIQLCEPCHLEIMRHELDHLPSEEHS